MVDETAAAMEAAKTRAFLQASILELTKLIQDIKNSKQVQS